MTRQNPGDPAGRPITLETRANPDETRRFADLGLEILRVGVGFHFFLLALTIDDCNLKEIEG